MVSPERMRLTASALTGVAGEGAVEIDDVQIFESLFGECPRLRGGVAC